MHSDGFCVQITWSYGNPSKLKMLKGFVIRLPAPLSTGFFSLEI
jgi:hypothetical protein